MKAWWTPPSIAAMVMKKKALAQWGLTLIFPTSPGTAPNASAPKAKSVSEIAGSSSIDSASISLHGGNRQGPRDVLGPSSMPKNLERVMYSILMCQIGP